MSNQPRATRLSLDARAAARLSVKKVGGVGLAGMAGWGEGANSGVVPDPKVKEVVGDTRKAIGAARLSITGATLTAAPLKQLDKVKGFGDRMDALVSFLPVNQPAYFLLFKSSGECIIVTYIPDAATAFDKMLYASTKNAVKDAILDVDDTCALEEFNVDSSSELSFANYQRKMNAPKPYTQQELERMEADQQEMTGNYGFLARMMALEAGKPVNKDVISGDANAKPVALPGIAGLKGGLAGIKLKKAQKVEEPVEDKDNGEHDPEKMYALNSSGKKFQIPKGAVPMVPMVAPTTKPLASPKQPMVNNSVSPKPALGLKNFMEKHATIQISNDQDLSGIRGKDNPVSELNSSIAQESAKEVVDHDSTTTKAISAGKTGAVANESVDETVNDFDAAAIEETSSAGRDTEEEPEKVTTNADVLQNSEEDRDNLDSEIEAPVDELKNDVEELDLDENADKLLTPSPNKQYPIVDIDEDLETGQQKEPEMIDDTNDFGFEEQMQKKIVKPRDLDFDEEEIVNQASSSSKMVIPPEPEKEIELPKAVANVAVPIVATSRLRRVSMASFEGGKKMLGNMKKIGKFAFMSRKSTTQHFTPDMLDQLDDEDGQYSYEELKHMKTAKRPANGVDATKLEGYLSSREFAEVFGMLKNDFDALPKKKQMKLKKKVGL